MKKMMTIVIPSIIVILFIAYHGNLFSLPQNTIDESSNSKEGYISSSNIEKEPLPTINPTTGTSITTNSSIKDNRKKDISNTTSTKKNITNSVNTKQYSNTSKSHKEIVVVATSIPVITTNDIPKKTEKKELFEADQLVTVETDKFFYKGISFTPYNDGKNLYIHSWEVQNLSDYAVQANVSVIFYDKDKKKIGSYMADKKTKKINYDENNKEDVLNPLYLDKNQTGTPKFYLDTSCLKDNHNFNDVSYVKILDCK